MSDQKTGFRDRVTTIIAAIISAGFVIVAILAILLMIKYLALMLTA